MSVFKCNVLRQHHFMVGIDIHDAIIPPSPIPIPWMPHAVGALLRVDYLWGTFLTGKGCPKVLTQFSNQTMAQFTDIGSFIPHVAVDALCPIYTLFSGSKSEFGASSVKLGGINGDSSPNGQGPVGVAVFGEFSFNLNCFGPTFPPLPLNVVFAPNTHRAGMTLADLIAGLVQMAVDSAVQFVFNRLFGEGFGKNKLGNFGSQLVDKLTKEFREAFAKKVVQSIEGKLGTGLVGKIASALAGESIKGLPGSIASALVGTPLGFSVPTDLLGPLGPGLNIGGPLANAVTNFLLNPNLEDIVVGGLGTTGAPLGAPAQ